MPASLLSRQCKYLIPQKAFTDLCNSVLKYGTFLDNDAVLIFVCGAERNGNKKTARERFMQYAEKHLSSYQFFMAEDFFKVFQNPTQMNLLQIENELTGFSDCVLILLESVGAFTELGAFANSDKIAKIILPVNEDKFRKSESFISMGPIAKLNKISTFKPCIYADFSSILTVVDPITDRLKKIERKKRKRIQLSTFEQFISIPNRHKMLFVMDLISLLNPISTAELISVLSAFYGSDYSYDLHLEISMLLALGMIIKIDDYYLPAINKNRYYYTYALFNIIEARSQIINHYHRYFDKKVLALKKKFGQ